ncbi:MAG: hypothetical protein SXG53_25645 [Pseudomonadota bacterium]|nr:hypothetical protein [Pseudomonadota bacterium]
MNELNAAIGELLDRLNDRVMRHVKQSRRELFDRLDRPALKPLPSQPYEYAEWGQDRVNIDYHLSVDDHFYSAPYTLTHETLWYRASQGTVELFHQGKRIASHVRSFKKYGLYDRAVPPPGLPSGAPGMDTLATDPVGTVDRCEHGCGAHFEPVHLNIDNYHYGFEMNATIPDLGGRHIRLQVRLSIASTLPTVSVSCVFELH